MTEPTVDFDMEEVERRLGEGEIRDRIREIKKEAFLAGVRAALTIVLGDRVTKRSIDSSPKYSMALAFVLRHPGYLSQFWSAAHMADIAGVSRQRMTHIVGVVRKLTSQPAQITRTHRKRRKRRKAA